MLWRASGRTLAPPEVDFRRHSVIGYFRFLRTGSRLAAESVEVRAGKMTVQLIESTPGECCVIPLGSGAPNVLIATNSLEGAGCRPGAPGSSAILLLAVAGT